MKLQMKKQLVTGNYKSETTKMLLETEEDNVMNVHAEALVTEELESDNNIDNPIDTIKQVTRSGRPPVVTVLLRMGVRKMIHWSLRWRR